MATIRGMRAIRIARKRGLQLFVWNCQRGWVPSRIDILALERSIMDARQPNKGPSSGFPAAFQHDLYIYAIGFKPGKLKSEGYDTDHSNV